MNVKDKEKFRIVPTLHSLLVVLSSLASKPLFLRTINYLCVKAKVVEPFNLVKTHKVWVLAYNDSYS